MDPDQDKECPHKYFRPCNGANGDLEEKMGYIRDPKKGPHSLKGHIRFCN